MKREIAWEHDCIMAGSIHEKNTLLLEFQCLALNSRVNKLSKKYLFILLSFRIYEDALNFQY